MPFERDRGIELVADFTARARLEEFEPWANGASNELQANTNMKIELVRIEGSGLATPRDTCHICRARDRKRVLVRSQTFERQVSTLRQAALRDFSLLTLTAIMLVRCLRFVLFILQSSPNPEKENSAGGNAAFGMTLIAQRAPGSAILLAGLNPPSRLRNVSQFRRSAVSRRDLDSIDSLAVDDHRLLRHVHNGGGGQHAHPGGQRQARRRRRSRLSAGKWSTLSRATRTV